MIYVNKKTGKFVSQLGTSNISTPNVINSEMLERLGFAEVQFTEKPTDGFFESGGIVEVDGIYKTTWVEVSTAPEPNAAIALLN
tara:strand:+ start:604 stop:855 length:252 start_codon:yes stop_codon:yes gene_type:complete